MGFFCKNLHLKAAKNCEDIILEDIFESKYILSIDIDRPLKEEFSFQNGAQHSNEFSCPCTFVRFTSAVPVRCGYSTLIKT